MDQTANLKGYLGNQNLKRSGQTLDWTKEMIDEYLRCAQDPIYFIETYMKVINVDEGLVNIKLRDYQVEMITSMVERRYTIIATARQAGKTTATCGFILWYVIFHADKTVALLANKGETAREILGKIQLAYMHLPKWLQQGTTEFNKGSFELENNSRIIAAATNSDAIRGYSINLLFIDEAAHIENWADFFASVFPTISSGKSTKIVLVSTPNGLNHFWAFWKDAEEKKNDYNRILVSWQNVPGRDEKWKEETLAAMSFDMEKFSQEHEVEFLGSSGTLISGWKLKELRRSVTINKKLGTNQYAMPEVGHAYMITVDVSRGKGLDYSAFQVIDITKMPYEQVCTFRNNYITPGDYEGVIYEMAKHYNNAMVMVEINDIGEAVARGLIDDFEYENILYTANQGKKGKILAGVGGSSKLTDPGIRTTKVVKNVGCSLLKLLVEQNQLILHDHETIEELKRFSRKGASYEAEEGSTDDLTMGLVLFAWATGQMYFKDMTDINTLLKLREIDQEQVEADLVPFGFVADGRGEIDIAEAPVFEIPPAKSWLYSD